MRLDLKLKEIYPEKTRNQLAKLIEKGCVTINDKVITKSSYKVEEEDEINLEMPEIEERDDLKPENIPLNIIYEDNDFLVINKQKGIAVHPGDDDSSSSGTIVNAVMYHCGDSLSGINGEKRPGIVHRLDKDTTGILIVAKNDKFHAHLAKQIEERKVKKLYRALVFGQPKDGVIEAPIGRSLRDRKKMSVRTGGKSAKTIFKVLEFFPEENVSLVEIELVTGRTHQIRVHFKSIGHPVIGDQDYGNSKINKIFEKKHGVTTQLLHAYLYEFEGLKGERKSFVAEEMDELLIF